jgi:hypothetical protein
MSLTCLVTIHGIGFNQPPIGDAPGYADDLHRNLASVLHEALGDDPHRVRAAPGDAGPVYVESLWPTEAGNPSFEEGLKRLGSWKTLDRRELQPNLPPLVPDGGPATIAHVALVYSRLEGIGPQPTAGFLAAAQALLNAAHYQPVQDLVHSLFLDVKALFRHPAPADAPPLSIRPRTDRPGAAAPASPTGETGVIGTVIQLEEDVAAYVARNGQRERVRDFVADALLRIAAREDVSTIVVNGHSNGTVISFDVLRDVPSDVSRDVAWTYVTAGSPLRKYRDLFSWGDEVGDVAGISWTNFYDDADPVADPLALRNPAELSSSGSPPARSTLFRSRDPVTGIEADFHIDDKRVDNLAHCLHPGGLQAHNYWDNLPDFVEPLAAILTRRTG